MGLTVYTFYSVSASYCVYLVVLERKVEKSKKKANKIRWLNIGKQTNYRPVSVVEAFNYGNGSAGQESEQISSSFLPLVGTQIDG